MKLQQGGLKACSQCGTTRTPQWREGPNGPKTLCNACGVKRVRSLRSNKEGGVRRKAAGKAQAARRAELPPGASPELATGRKACPRGDPDAAVAASPPEKRQRRAAAVKAASRALEFATTGHWPDDEEGCTVPMTVLARGASPPGEGRSESHNSSEHTAEVDVWGSCCSAREDLMAFHQPLANHVGEPSSAAIGLLAMSMPEEEVRAVSRLRHPEDTPQHSDTEGSAHGAGLRCPPASTAPLHGTFERLAWARRALPHSPQLTRLMRPLPTATPSRPRRRFSPLPASSRRGRPPSAARCPRPCRRPRTSTATSASTPAPSRSPRWRRRHPCDTTSLSPRVDPPPGIVGLWAALSSALAALVSPGMGAVLLSWV
uniref:GATA-type domain-containing protein n=1 Tax=Tetraselmis sp. GSL018 TaxID=582737 RepID=A0A061RNS3_9CHLO